MNPFPLSNRIRLAMVAWMVYLAAFIMPTNDYGFIYAGWRVAYWTWTTVYYMESSPYFGYELPGCMILTANNVLMVASFFLFRVFLKWRFFRWTFTVAVFFNMLSFEAGFAAGNYAWNGSFILLATAFWLPPTTHIARRFQFRLSTLLVLSIAIGILIYLNMLWYAATVNRPYEPRVDMNADLPGGLVIGFQIPISLLLLVVIFDGWERWRAARDIEKAKDAV